MSDKYSQVERERKYLMDADVIKLNELSAIKIIDHYILNSRLRLRQVVDNNGTTYKLTKKTLQTGRQLGKYSITTIYLDKKEYTQLLQLKAVWVSKTRYYLEEKGVRIAIDQYRKRGQQLLIAEVEFSTDEAMGNFRLSVPYLREVTDETEFEGYELAKRFGGEE